MATVGDNLRRLRLQRGWTQAQLARRLGTTSSYAAQLERRVDTVSPKAITQIAKALRIEPGELLAGVITEYDRLRGAVEPTPTRGPVQSDVEAELLLKRWRRMDGTSRKILLELAERLEP